MLEKEIIDFAKEYIEELFEGEFSGHDYWHTIRVFKLAKYIAKIEGADEFIVMLSSLLHDVDDRKIFPKTYDGKKNAVYFMEKCGLDDEIIFKVLNVIDEISFGKNEKSPSTIEAKCVQDADRLDAIGAIGIGRAFAYGGNKNRAMYDPKISPKLNMTKEEYRSSKSTTINHFYEKLFRLKDLMNTETGKKIAIKRDAFMRKFVDEFMREWNVEF